MWAVENPAVGSFTGASLDIPGFPASTAEVSRVTATLGEIGGEAQVTVVAYRRTGPQTDFFFVLPYLDGSGNMVRPLDFGTEVPSADVFFLMDTTGSMFGEITNLQNALNSIVVPGVQTEIPDTQFGAGVAEDFPVDPYGATSGADCGRGGEVAPDQPFKLFQTITDNINLVTTAVGNFTTATGPIGCGADLPESNVEAMYQAATGEGITGPGLTSVPANSTGVGGVGFRDGVMPIIVPISDAVSHAADAGACGSGYAGAVGAVAHSRDETKTVLNNICAKIVGVSSLQPSVNADCMAEPDFEDFATATGARVPPAAWDVPARPAGCAAGQCCTSYNGAGRAPDGHGLCPLVFRADSNGSGLGSHIVTGIKMLTRFATFDVTTENIGETQSLAGVDLPGMATSADFIKAVTPVSFMVPPAPPVIPDPTFDATGFQGVTPGTTVSFDVTAYNDFVPETTEAQIFRATIRVLAGGCTDLDEREVFILVPPIPVAIE